MNTIANITNSALDYSPLGVLRAMDWSPSSLVFSEDNKFKRIAPEKGSPEYNALMARGILGSMAMCALWALGQAGMEEEKEGKVPKFAIYGPGPSDPNIRRQWSLAGWHPYSIRIGDTTLPYRDLPAVSLILGALGTAFDTRRFLRNPEDKSPFEVSKIATIGIVSNILDKNMLSGVSNIFDLIRNPNQRGAIALEKFSSSMISGITNPRLLDQIGQQFRTDDKGELIVPDRAAEGSWLASILPFGIGTNKPALNVLGEVITQHRAEPVTRRFANLFEDVHPTIAPLVKAGMHIPGPSKEAQFIYYGKKYRLSQSENAYRRFVELRGESLRAVLTPQAVERLVVYSQRVGADKAQKKLGDITEKCRDSAIRRLQLELRANKLSF